MRPNPENRAKTVVVRACNTVLLAGLVAVLAGCGGSRHVATTTPVTTAPSTTAPADPGKVAIDAFAAAARKGDARALWALLSTQSRDRLGPTLGQFEKGQAAELHKGVGAFTRFRTIVSERITPEFGVVAIDGVRNGRRDVYAAALRLQGEDWKVEAGGPVVVRPIGPDPGSKEQVVAQIAGAVKGPGGAGTAVMYLDGATLNPQVRGTASNSTLFTNFDRPIDPGRHTVVLFASDGREASASAWAFTVGKG